MNLLVKNLIIQLKNLYDFGVSNHKEDFVEEMLREMYLVGRRDEEYQENVNPLIELLFNYDFDHFDIGGISFLPPSEWIFEDNFIYIGSDGSGDFICLDKDTDAIYDYIDRVEYEKIEDSSYDFFMKLIRIGKYTLSKSGKSEADKNLLLDEIATNMHAKKFYSSLLS